ncbi:MAG TPA: VOC family protein [Povalibacter sp.]|nr:VOC family protein [Povalibacter sp.]
MGNPVTQWQIVSTNPEATTKFCGKLFGWTVASANALGYRTVDTQSPDGIGGGIWPAPAGAHSMVQLFIEVDDVDAHLDKAVSLGAKIIVPKSALPDGDTMAVVLDPTGLPFGIYRPAARR